MYMCVCAAGNSNVGSHALLVLVCIQHTHTYIRIYPVSFSCAWKKKIIHITNTKSQTAHKDLCTYTCTITTHQQYRNESIHYFNTNFAQGKWARCIHPKKNSQVEARMHTRNKYSEIEVRKAKIAHHRLVLPLLLCPRRPLSPPPLDPVVIMHGSNLIGKEKRQLLEFFLVVWMPFTTTGRFSLMGAKRGSCVWHGACLLSNDHSRPPHLPSPLRIQIWQQAQDDLHITRPASTA